MIYFASDIHLGSGTPEQQKATERLFVGWLSSVAADASAIFLCGDIFDFWFEYKRVVPKGFVRTLGKIAELTDRGVRVVFMAGNHDMWLRDYFIEECGMEVYTTPTTFELSGKRVHVAHGDNLKIKKNLSLRAMNAFFRSAAARILFRSFIHPDLALKFGQWWSGSSRKKHEEGDQQKRFEPVEFLREYALEHYAEHHDHIYIFGHLHCARSFDEQTPQILFMNDWSSEPHYVAMDSEGNVKLLSVKY